MGTWRTLDVRGARGEANARAVVDAGLAAGTTLFDTSPMYGSAERVLSAVLGARRRDALVADKVWASSVRDGHAQVARALDWYDGVVDIYQVHNLVAWREQIPLLETLKARGATRVIGVTQYDHGAFPELLTVMARRRIQMIQIPYNASDRVVEREVLPLAASLNLGVLVMQPLASGALVRRSPGARALERLDRFGVRTWAQALLKWVLSDLRVHGVLAATSDPAHATENAAAGDPPWFDDETRGYVAHLAVRAA